MKSSPFLSLLTQNISNKSSEESFENSTLDNKFDFSKELLNKGLLFTPHLKKNFGNIYVCEIGLKHIESEEIYIRESVIKQKDTDYEILAANLRIEKSNVPIQLINDLKSTTVPFGTLLKKYNIDITIKDQEIIAIRNVDNSGTTRMGRSRTMIQKGTGVLICKVHELLNSEQHLLAAKKHKMSA